MNLHETHCPTCQSTALKPHMTYTTHAHGPRTLYQCHDCDTYFSETKHTVLEGLRTPISRIWTVLEARTEGMGLNAAARVFHAGKSSILKWEQRFANLYQVLMVYALMHQFLDLVIEGDEAYTKVEKNRPPHESPGWTIALMDRASRFLWDLECGERDEGLFRHAVEILRDVSAQTDDLSLLTDGEHR